MTWIMVDIEADGPCPGLYSMVSFGAVAIFEDDLTNTFFGQTKPISDKWQEGALKACNLTREETMKYDDPGEVMQKFADWLEEVCKLTKGSNKRPMFISDNNGFDWQFINYYFHRYLDRNPFGFSSTNQGSLYKGLVRDTRKNFKHLRKTKHTHHPVDDAMGNAEALVEMKKKGLGISF